MVPGNPNNMLPDLMHINNPQSQMGFVNPQQTQPSMPFNNNSNYTPHMGNPYRPPPGPMNAPPTLLGSAPQFVQGLNVSAFPFHGQLPNFSQGNQAQFFGHNNNNNIPLNMVQPFNQVGLQNMNMNSHQYGNLQPLLNLNPTQVAVLAQLMGCANQVVAQAMVPQNTAFVGNTPQLGLVQPNNVMRPQLPVASQQMMQNFSPTQCNPALSNPHHSQSPGMQGNPGKIHGMQDSYQHRNNNFMKRPQRDTYNQRFQKSQHHHTHNTKRNHKIPDKNGGKGHKGLDPDNSANLSKSGKRRSLAAFYTEKEIQLWREERKKNFPSKSNVEKRLAEKQANADAAVEEAKLRRLQLKDVLAKQAELGFEVPEIPSHYLMDAEDLPHGKDGNRKPFNSGRFQKKTNKRGKFDKNNCFDKKRGPEGDGSSRRNERFTKRKRVEEGVESSTNPRSIKKPTLLQKLLSPDIKRDEHRLLQALHFMVMNSFFKDWPAKALDFPKVIVKETEVGSEVIEPKPFSSDRQPAGSIEDHDTSDDSHGENDGCQEEGEITD